MRALLAASALIAACAGIQQTHSTMLHERSYEIHPYKSEPAISERERLGKAEKKRRRKSAKRARAINRGK